MKVDSLQPYFFQGRLAFVMQGAMIKAPASTSDRKNNVGEVCHPIFSLLTSFSRIYWNFLLLSNHVHCKRHRYIDWKTRYIDWNKNPEIKRHLLEFFSEKN